MHLFRRKQKIDFQLLARQGVISGPYRTRQLPSLAWVFSSPGPLPIWIRYRTKRELDLIERPEEVRTAKRSLLFGLF
jgi:hypothetical protein